MLPSSSMTTTVGGICSRDEHLHRKQQLYARFGDEVEKILASGTTGVGVDGVGAGAGGEGAVAVASWAAPPPPPPPLPLPLPLPLPPYVHEVATMQQQQQQPAMLSAAQQLDYLLRKKGITAAVVTAGVGPASASAPGTCATTGGGGSGGANIPVPVSMSMSLAGYSVPTSASTPAPAPAPAPVSVSTQMYQLLAAKGVISPKTTTSSSSSSPAPAPAPAPPLLPPYASTSTSALSSRPLRSKPRETNGSDHFSSSASCTGALNDLTSVEQLVSKVRTYCVRVDAENAELRAQLAAALQALARKEAECAELLRVGALQHPKQNPNPLSTSSPSPSPSPSFTSTSTSTSTSTVKKS